MSTQTVQSLIDLDKLLKVESVDDIEQGELYVINNLKERSSKKFIVVSKCIIVNRYEDEDFSTAEFNDVYAIRNDWNDGLLQNWDIDKTDFNNIYDMYYITGEDYPEFYI
jgi:hypothetical protein